MQLVSRDSKLKQPFIVPTKRSTSRRFTSISTLKSIGRSTPDAGMHNTACPDVLLTSSQRKSCRGLSRLCNSLTQERDFLPGVNARVSIPSIR